MFELLPLPFLCDYCSFSNSISHPVYRSFCFCMRSGSTCGHYDHFISVRINSTSNFNKMGLRRSTTILRDEGSPKRTRVVEGNAFREVTPFIKILEISSSRFLNTSNEASNQVAPINKPLDPANGRPDQGDWRGKYQPGRHGRHERTVNKLFDTLKRRFPFSDQKGLRQLPKLAQRFEERIFTAATSESDYAMKIFLKILKIETKLQRSLANNMTWNQIDPSDKPLDPANVRPNQGDWRDTLQPGAREKFVNRIMYTLKQQLPIDSSQEGSDEFGKIVRSFEEGIFTAATDKADYVSKIYLKTQCQDPEMNIIALKLAQLMNRNR